MGENWREKARWERTGGGGKVGENWEIRQGWRGGKVGENWEMRQGGR